MSAAYRKSCGRRLSVPPMEMRFFAALAVGDVDRTTIQQWNPVASAFHPDTATYEAYERQWSVFRDLYPKTRDLMKRLGA